MRGKLEQTTHQSPSGDTKARPMTMKQNYEPTLLKEMEEEIRGLKRQLAQNQNGHLFQSQAQNWRDSLSKAWKSYFHHLNWDADIDHIQYYLESTKILQVNGHGRKLKDVIPLEPFVNLERLFLENLTVANMDTLGKLKNLKRLVIKNCLFVRNWSFLSSLENLEYLELNHIHPFPYNTKSIDLRLLAELPNLEKVRFVQTNLINASALEEHECLETFEYDTYFSIEGFSELRNERQDIMFTLLQS